MNQYIDDLHSFAAAMGLRIAFPRIDKLASYMPLPLFRIAIDSVGRMRYYAKDSIRRYEQTVAADPYDVKPTLFTKTFNAKEEAMPQAEVVANAQGYIIAGAIRLRIAWRILPGLSAATESSERGLLRNFVACPMGIKMKI
jgi:hypothetical protein